MAGDASAASAEIASGGGATVTADITATTVTAGITATVATDAVATARPGSVREVHDLDAVLSPGLAFSEHPVGFVDQHIGRRRPGRVEREPDADPDDR